MKKINWLRKLVAAVAAALLLLVLPTQAQAQSLRMGLAEMTAEADSVLTGTVIGRLQLVECGAKPYLYFKHVTWPL